MGNTSSNVNQDFKNFWVKDVGGIYQDVIRDDTFKKITGTLGSTLTTGLSGFSNLFGNVLNSANKLVTSAGSLLTPTTMYMILGCVAVGGIIYLTRK